MGYDAVIYSTHRTLSPLIQQVMSPAGSLESLGY